MATVSVNPSARPDAEAVLNRVAQRMRDSGGFPSLSQAVEQITQAMEESREDTNLLASLVLSDFGLTQKVLRLANSAMYAPMGGRVSSVSRALMVLGYQAVGHLALGARLITSLNQSHPHTRAAERELAQSLLAGSIATAVAGAAARSHAEVGVVCSLLHHVGRLLVVFFLPEEWRRIEKFVHAGRDEDDACRAVLGLTWRELGARTAEDWRLPTDILRTLDPKASDAADPQSAWTLAITRFANRAAGLHARQGDPARLDGLIRDFAPALGLEPGVLRGAMRDAVDQGTAEPLLARLLLDRPSGPAQVDDPLAALREAIRDLRQVAQEGGRPLELQRIALEAMYSALGLSRAVLFLRPPGEPVYRAAAVLSHREPDPLAGLAFPETFQPDVVHIALAKQVDFYIDNPRSASIATRMPDWLRAHEPTPFFLLPLRGEPAGGLYFGQQADTRALDKDVLALLKELRELAQGS